MPGVAGPHGQNIPMAAPYNMAPPGNQWAAQQMMSNSVPLNMVQINRGGNAPGMSGVPGGNMPMTPIPSGGLLTPPGVPFAPGIPGGPNVTPSSFMPGAGGGIIPANVPPGANTGGIMLAQLGGGAPPGGPGGGIRFSAQRTQIRFTRPTGMKVAWFAQGPDGRPTFSNVPLEAPARYNFTQGAIYKLKISGVEGRPGLEVYPTMEVVPANPKTEAFLAHSAVPLEFTQDDFKQIAEGNYVTKVIYLPDPQFQDVAGSGTDEIVSTRLEPGADPIQEALRRGSILVIIRMGNVDEEAPNTPPLNAGAPAGPAAGGQGQPNMPPHIMVPYPGYMPKTGALPPGGPMIGAPGNAQLPPGFNPLFPPPGVSANLPPLPPLPPSADLTPGTLAPPPAKVAAPLVGEKKLDVPALPQIPPPVAPTPSTSETKKTPEFNPIIPPPVAPTPTIDAKKTTDVNVPPLPVAPPLAPNAGDTKKTDVTAPPLPTFPSSKTSDALPMVTPASAPPLPMIPEVTGPPIVPAFPTTPGTIRPADPLSSTPDGSSAQPMPSGAGKSR